MFEPSATTSVENTSVSVSVSVSVLNAYEPTSSSISLKIIAPYRTDLVKIILKKIFTRRIS